MIKFERIALIIGIDKYKKPIANLKCCVRDAHAMKDTLTCHEDGVPNFDCSKTFTSKNNYISKSFLLSEIDTFFELESSVALFYFSGHGFVNNLGGYLVTQDAEAYKEGVRMDDVMNLAIKSIKAGRMKEVVFVLDCCHSGFFGQLPILNDTDLLCEGISILAASRNYESAYEVNGSGRFTKLVINALKGGAKDLCGEVKIPAIYAYVDDALGAVEQRPVFKSNVSKLIALRNCHIDIDTSVLRFLPELFKNPKDKYQLSPSFLSGKRPEDLKNQKLFTYLTFFEDRQLIRTIDHYDLSAAAKKFGFCVLNEVGQYYWNLINDYNLKKIL